jgi:hypothetical protein
MADQGYLDIFAGSVKQKTSIGASSTFSVHYRAAAILISRSSFGAPTHKMWIDVASLQRAISVLLARSE